MFTCRRTFSCAWGTHQSSANVNETASEVDRKYIERSQAKGIYPLMYYSHNLHFVSFARMMQGKYDEALDYARRLRSNVDGAIDDMPMLAPYGTFEWLVLARFPNGRSCWLSLSQKKRMVFSMRCTGIHVGWRLRV